MVLHIPHSSVAIEDDVAAEFLLSKEALEQELVKMTDAWTDDLFDLEGAKRVVFNQSRLVIDVERFPVDEDEPMAKKGMGASYVKTSGGEDLKWSNRKALMDRFYYPHHAQLTSEVEKLIERLGSCLIVDCHSFPSNPLPCDLNQEVPRPPFCIGTQGVHSPEWLIEGALDGLASSGWRAELNNPYSGSIVPLKFLENDERVLSLMIEVRRDLYMDETTGAKSPAYQVQKRLIQGLLQSLATLHRSKKW